jgi:hypothetical protein
MIVANFTTRDLDNNDYRWEFVGIGDIAECFPDDQDGVALAVSNIMQTGEHVGGGGAMPMYRLVEAKGTWIELSTLAEGTKVRFTKAWDIFPEALIPAGATGTIIEQGLNDIWCALRVRPDDEAQAGQLRHWDRCIVLHGPSDDDGTQKDCIHWWDKAPVEAVR